MRRSLALLVALAALVTPAAGRADGDPASDFLLVRSLFLPYNSSIDEDTLGRLEAVVGDAQERKFPIRVALIAQPYDLGSVFQLYRQPQRYAQFLGQELLFKYGGRLLVAMPNGFGYAEGGREPKLARALGGIPAPGRDPTKLAAAATTAVRRLAAAAGHPLPPPRPSGSSSETRDRVTIAAAVGIGLALIAAVVVVRRLRVQRREPA